MSSSHPECFPLAQGNRWTYRVVGETSIGYHTASIGKLEVSVDGQEEIELPANKKILAWKLTGGWQGADDVLATSNGVQIYTRRSEEGGPLAAAALTADLRWGEQKNWESGYPAGHVGHILGKRLANETVAVPAGTFDCIKITQQNFTWKSTFWLAAKVGVVKQVVTRLRGSAESQQIWELVAFDSHPPGE